VLNNPILSNDPTGHSSNPVASYSEIPPQLVWLIVLIAGFSAIREHTERRHDAYRENCQGTLADCFNQQATKKFVNNQSIDSQEFHNMLDAINTDLSRKWRTQYDLARAGYDTPFFNGDSRFDNDVVEDMIVCIDDKCSPQSTVNYVAQGMYSAYTGQSLEDAYELADDWNQIMWNHDANEDEKFWIGYGYNYYNTKKVSNNPKSINKNPYYQVPI
jgi:hypothetical protein